MGQEASGIKVGDTVQVIKKARSHEGGWRYAWFSAMDDIIEFVVLEINSDGGMWMETGSGMRWWFPYFVLEIVKKATGSVLGKDNTNSERNSNMKNTKYDCEVVTEFTDGNGNKRNETIVPRYPLWAANLKDAREAAIAKHGEVYLKARAAKDTEVAIVCRPFCTE